MGVELEGFVDPDHIASASLGLRHDLELVHVLGIRHAPNVIHREPDCIFQVWDRKANPVLCQPDKRDGILPDRKACNNCSVFSSLIILKRSITFW